MERSTLHWLASATKDCHLRVLLLTLCQVLDGASVALYALLLRRVVDAATQTDVAGFWRAALFLVLLVALQVALRAVMRRAGEYARATLENALKSRLMRALLYGDLQLVGATHSAEWINRLTNDAVVVANGCATLVPGVAGTTTRLASALVMIVALDPRLAAILVPASAVLVALALVFRVRLKRLHKAIQEADGRLRVVLQEHLSSALVVRSFAVEQDALAEESRHMEEHKAARMRKNAYANLCNICYGAAMNGLYVLGVVWCGHALLRGSMSFGTLTAILQLISRIQAPLGSMSGYLPQYYSMLASADRLREAESVPRGVHGHAVPLSDAMRFYEDMLCGFGLRDVSFAYGARAGAEQGPSGPAAGVRNVSFEVRKGEFVALTGHSGCGKSTSLKLLMAAYAPQQGLCCLTTKGGKVADLDDRWRTLFAYVPQGNMLMTGTVRQAVCLSDPGKASDDARLWEALRIACADEFVRELEDGAETMLGERGAGLSEGQMQRLSIARAVFSERPVLLLDEATSALDEKTELAVLCNLRSLAGRTVLIVTHRRAVANACDRELHFTEEGLVSE